MDVRWNEREIEWTNRARKRERKHFSNMVPNIKIHLRLSNCPHFVANQLPFGDFSFADFAVRVYV